MDKQIEIPEDEMGMSGYSKFAWELWQHLKLSMDICEKVDKFIREKDYCKQIEGEWLSAYDYALKLGITDEKTLSDAKENKWWKYCNLCDQAVKGFHNYCPHCGAKMKGGSV